MKLATLAAAADDAVHGHGGRLVVVSRNLRLAADATDIAPTLLDAIERWDAVAPGLQRLSDALNAGRAGGTSAIDAGSVSNAFAFDAQQCLAPLPRAPQWLDASAFLNHARLMEQAFNTPPMPKLETTPVMYQGASDDFLGPHADVPLPSEADGIDFEGEFGVVVGAVPMAASAEQALAAVRLVVQINDWSLRALGPHEMKTGFGFLQAKPSTAFAPVAVTPDELGAAWRDGRVWLRLQVLLNGQRIGEPNGGEMHFGFGELVAHAARTRRLSAGSIVGSGTVSNVSRAAGSACLAERRVIEMIDEGTARTPFMRFGDRVQMQAVLDDGDGGPFGAIDQRVVPAPAPGHREQRSNDGAAVGDSRH